MNYLFELELPSLPMQGTDSRFPINRVFCVGRNYEDHAREMGGDVREPPFFFSKPATAVFVPNEHVPYPSRTDDFHHEVELVVALGSGGRGLTAEQARDCVLGYAVGVDFTRRDLQLDAKQHGRPWDVAKGFDASGPVSALISRETTGWLTQGRIALSVNGELRQQGNLASMIWAVDEIIAELSTYYTLQPGDVIFTGTPAGVSAVVPGDRIEAAIDGVGRIAFKVI